MNRLPDQITLGDKYRPAMQITDPEEARAYFEVLVEHNMRMSGRDRGAAETVERANLGYFCGYYDYDTWARVERLFGCVHPILGPVAQAQKLNPLAIFEIGKAMGDLENARDGAGRITRR